MTRNDYYEIAQAILETFSYDCDSPGEEKAVGMAVQRLADKFEGGAEFDRKLFLEQAGLYVNWNEGVTK